MGLGGFSTEPTGTGGLSNFDKGSTVADDAAFGGSGKKKKKHVSLGGKLLHDAGQVAKWSPFGISTQAGLHLASDIKTAAPQMPVGIYQLAGAVPYDLSHPGSHATRDIVGGMGRMYQQQYWGGKGVVGHLKYAGSQAWKHPLQPFLDVMTAFTLGGAGAARLGEAGLLGERGAALGKAGTREFKVYAPDEPGGFKSVLKPTSANPYTRAMQNLRHNAWRKTVRGIETGLKRDIYFNEHATGVRIESKIGMRGHATQLRRDLHPFDTAFRGLKAVEEVAVSLRAQGLHPTEYRNFISEELDAARTAIENPDISNFERRKLQQSIKAHERMLKWTEGVTPELYDSVLTNPKLAKAHQAASDIMDAAAETGMDFNILNPEDVANRPFLAVRVMRGARYTPLEEVAQKTLEANPARAEIHGVVDQVVKDPILREEIKNRMDATARWYAQYHASTPEQAAKSADRFYDTMKWHALPGEIPNTMWEGLPDRLLQAAKQADTSKPAVVDAIWAEVQRIQESSPRGIGEGHNMVIPPDMLTREGVEARVDTLIKQALEGEAAKAWYTHSGEDILKQVDGDLPSARKVAQLVAMTSPQQTVFNNVRSSIELFNLYKQIGDKEFGARVAKLEAALKVHSAAMRAEKAAAKAEGRKAAKLQGPQSQDYGLKVSGLVTSDQYPKALQIMRGDPVLEKILGQKTHSFYRNFLQEFDPEYFRKAYPDETPERGPVTFDTWMRRALNYPRSIISAKTKTITKKQLNYKAEQLLEREDPAGLAALKNGDVESVTIHKYNEPIGPKAYLFGEYVTSAVADILGWKPHEAQAAIWTSIKNEWEKNTGRGGEFHIGNAFDRVAEEKGVSLNLAQKHPYKNIARGLYTPATEDAVAQLHFGVSADVDTVIHELAHHVQALMEGQPFEASFAKKMGATPKPGKGYTGYTWPVEAREAFANSWLSWMREQPGSMGDITRQMFKEDHELPVLKPSVRKAFDRMNSPKKLKGAILHGGPSIEELKSLEGLIAHPHIGESVSTGGRPQAGAGLGRVKKPGLAKWNHGWRLLNSQWLPGPQAFRSSYLRTMGYAAAVKRGEYAFSIGSPLEDIGTRQPGWYLVKENKLKDTKILRSEREAPGIQEAYNEFEKADGGDVERLINRDVATQDAKTAEQWQQQGYRVREIPPGDYKAIFGEFKQANKMIQRFVDKPTEAWRTLTLTYRPAWVVNNIVGQTFLYAVNHAGKGSIKAYAQAASELRRGESTLPDELGGGFVRSETPAIKAARAGAGGDVGTRAWRTFWRGEHRVRDGIQRFNAAISDDLPRLATYKAIINRMEKTDATAARLNEYIINNRGNTKGLTGEMKVLHDQLVQEVLDQLIDFGNLSYAERAYVRRFVPFYSWIKGITKATGKLGFEHPGRALILLWLGKLGQQQSEKNFGPGSQNLKGFIPFGNAAGKVVSGLSTTGYNPYATVGQLAGQFGGTVGNSSDPSDNPFLQFNPLAQAIFATASGVDPFTRQPIDKPRAAILLGELIGAPPQAALIRDMIHPKTGDKKLTKQTRWDLALRYAGWAQTHKRPATATSLVTKPPGR